MESLAYGNTVLHFDLEYSERRSLAIEVHPDTSVRVKAPLESSMADVEKKLLKRASWIIRQQKYFSQFLPRTPEREYVRGESHKYLGKAYPLKILTSKQRDVKLKGGQLIVFTPSDDPVVVKALLSAWYYNHTVPKIEEIYKETLPRFNRFDIGVPKMEIRRMKNRWGSCTPKGKILINPELIKTPRRCIEYVMIHEMCHLVVPSHNKKFYKVLGEVMPNWERWKQRLELTSA